MKKILLSLLLISLILCGCTAEKRDQETLSDHTDIPEYVIAIPYWQDDVQLEQAAEQINGILKDRLGIQVEFLTFPISRYNEEMEKVLAGTRQVDIMFTLRNYVENWLMGNLLPIDEYIPEYGRKIQELFDPDVLESCRIDGHLYGIPNLRDYAVTTDTYFLNSEILDKYDIDVKDIRNPDDLEEIFARIHADDENIVILSSNLTAVTENLLNLNSQTQFITVLDEDKDLYVDYLETQEYRDILHRIRRWQQSGYIGFTLENGEISRKNGTVFAEARCGKPGAEEEVSAQRGQRYEQVCFGSDVITQNVYTFNMYTITKNTISAQGSMMLLDELYSDPQINRILSQILWSWFVPNLFLTNVPENCPDDLWEQTRTFNEQAQKAADVRFVFDPAAVMKEYMDVRQIYETYKPVLENGLVDVDRALDRMISELHDAGIDYVIEEQNRQYKEWKNNIS